MHEPLSTRASPWPVLAAGLAFLAVFSLGVLRHPRGDHWSGVVSQADAAASTLSSDALASAARHNPWEQVYQTLVAADAPLGALVRAAAIAYERRAQLGATETTRRLGDLTRRIPAAPTRLSPALRARIVRWTTALYAETSPVAASRAQDLSRDIDATPIGWFGSLARKHLAQRAGDDVGVSRWQQVLRDRANRRVARLGGMGLFVLLLALGGLVAWASFFARRARERQSGEVIEPIVGAAESDPLFWGVAVYFGSMLGAAGLLEAAGRTRAAGPRMALLTGLAVTVGASVVSLWGLSRLLARRSMSAADLGWPSRDLRTDLRWGLAGYCAMLPLLLPMVCVVQRLLPNLPSSPHPVVGVAGTSEPTWVKFAVFATAVALAPVLEEIFFRGVLLNAIWARTGRRWLAVLVSAAMFAVIHPQQYVGWVGVFAVGLVLGTLYVERRNLLPSIIMHAVNNAIALWAAKAVMG